MATNFEFYVDALIETLGAADQKKCSARTAQVALGMEEADSCTCVKKTCANCWAGILETLKQEHIEQPKLTKRERAFCEAVQTGWIARDGEYLYWHIVQPIKDGNAFVFPNSKDGVPMVIKTKGLAFDVIKNKEMMAVEYLLEMEVEA